MSTARPIAPHCAACHPAAGLAMRFADLFSAPPGADGPAPALPDGVVLLRCGAPGTPFATEHPWLAIVCGGPAPYCTVLAGPELAGWKVAGPHSALLVRLDVPAVAELLVALERRAPAATPAAPAAPAIKWAALDDATANAALRLLQTLVCPDEARILGPAIVRELLYRLLTGPLGDAARGALRQRVHAGIGRALRRIHETYGAPVDVTTLARDASMSVTAFHAHFKTVTGTTPIQYLKATRLNKARLLMAQDGVSAAAASHLVGYESSSQFSREFKRQFGRTPGHDAAALRRALQGVCA